MNYDDVISDFAERTLRNLHAIELLQAERCDVFEVTQLVNSMLGLLVFPQQEYIDQIPKTPLEKLKQDGWPIPECPEGLSPVQNLNQFVKHLRNAIAHFNIEFIADASREITGLRLWNTARHNHKKTWEAELSLSDLRGFAERFTTLLFKVTRQKA